MPDLGNALFQLRADSSTFGRDIGNAEGTVKGAFGRMETGAKGSFGRIGDAARGSFAGIRKSVVALGGVMAGAFVAAGAVNFGKEAVNIASDIGESASKNQVIFGNFSKEVDEFAQGTAKSLGLARNETLQYSGALGNLFRGANLGEGAAQDMSEQLIKRSADIASFNNAAGGTSEVLAAIQSGLAGETEPLRKFGVFLNEDAIQAEALSSGLAKAAVDMTKLRSAQVQAEKAQVAYAAAVKEFGANSLEARSAQAALETAQARVTKVMAGQKVELTQAQKTQAIYNLVLKQSANAAGDFEKTSGGLANQQRILAATVTDLKGRLGTALLPAVLAVVKGFNTLVQSSGFDAFITSVTAGITGVVQAATNLGPTLGAIGNHFTQAVRFGNAWTDSLTGIPTGIQGVVRVVGGLGQTLNGLAQYLRLVVTDGDYLNDYLSHLPAAFRGPVESVGILVSAIRELFTGEGGGSDAEALAARIRGVIDQARAGITSIDFSALGTKVIAVLSSINYSPLIDKIVAMDFTPIGNKIREAISGQLENLAIGGLSTAGGPLGAVIGKAYTADIGGIQEKLRSFAAFIGANIVPLLQRFATSAAGFLSGLMPFLRPFFDSFRNNMPQLRAALTDVIAGFRAMQPAVAPVAAFLGGVLLGALEAIIPMIRLLAAGFKVAGQVIGGIGTLLTPLVPILDDVGRAVGFVFGPAILGPLGAAFGAVGRFIPLLSRFGGTFGQVFGVVGTLLRGFGAGIARIGPIINTVLGGAGRLVARFAGSFGTTIAGLIARVTTQFGRLPGIVQAALGAMRGTAAAGIRNVVEAITGAVEGLPKAINTTLGNVGTAIQNTLSSAVRSIRETAQNFFIAGQNMMIGFINGIISQGGKLIDAIKRTITDALPGFVKKALGIDSPSKVFARFGRNTMEGFAVGIAAADRIPQRALERAVTGLQVPALAMGGALPTAPATAPLVSSGGSGDSININGTANPLEVARLVGRELQFRQTSRRLQGAVGGL